MWRASHTGAIVILLATVKARAGKTRELLLKKISMGNSMARHCDEEEVLEVDGVGVAQQRDCTLKSLNCAPKHS